jgi:RNA polymerase-binding transcription factor
MTKLTTTDTKRFEQRLRARHAELRQHVRDVLLESKREDFAELAGRVHDRGEEAVADLLTSTNVAVLEREVNELRDVEAALQRIRTGSYGVCDTCGDDIERERLEAYPAAERCVDCERDREVGRAGGRDQTPSI